MKNSGKALDQKSLEDLALRYVGRYATTRHKLTVYLNRKLHERDWKGEEPAKIEPLIERMTDLGYIDDTLYAKNRAASLARRGYGKRRVSEALYRAGIREGDDREALDLTDHNKWKAAKTFARKKSIGPYALEKADREKSQKQLQAFLRAGHSYDIAARFVFAKPGEPIDQD